tara:strand:- start:630 stop:1607 length:978 start_codon:yes stop_codon:yes gene_type:complete
MSTFKQKKALNVQLAAAQKKHGAKSQAAGRIQYKINQLNQTQRKDSKGRSLGTAVRTSNGSVVKSGTGGTVRTKPTVLSQSQKALATKKKTIVKPVVKKSTQNTSQINAMKVADKNATKNKKTIAKKTEVKVNKSTQNASQIKAMKLADRNATKNKKDNIPFGRAFNAARAKGEKVFTWKGKKFTTNLRSKQPAAIAATVVKKPAAIAATVVKKPSDSQTRIAADIVKRKARIAAEKVERQAKIDAKKAKRDAKKAADKKAADKKAAEKAANKTALKAAEEVAQQLANENITTPSFQQLATWTTTKLGAWLEAGKQRVKDAKTNK